jgi:hypothetical protein
MKFNAPYEDAGTYSERVCDFDKCAWWILGQGCAIYALAWEAIQEEADDRG